jgi:Mn2+/Fe2+ NRAMP family transporter
MPTTIEHSAQQTVPESRLDRLKMVGPGLVAAATGVGGGDIVASIVAGADYGMALVWAAVVGAFLKYYLAEGVGRWHLATDSTIIDGWNSLGKWANSYFAVYILVWGFVFGAAAASSTALPLNALFPGIPFKVWAIGSSIVGLLLVGLGRYELFEKTMSVLIAIMFVTVVGTAIAVGPNWGDFTTGLVPTLPEGSLLNALALMGGVGGTITLAAYGYWLREKRWRGPKWLPVMRTDNRVAYASTAVFAISLIVVGAELLFSGGLTIEGESGLITVGDVLNERFGGFVELMFLVGFWAAAFTSLLGVWNGVSYLFADFVRVMRRIPDSEADEHLNERSPAFRFYLAWLTFPPMVLLFAGEPFGLVLIYAALGAFFMPFLAVTLLWLLNSDRVTVEFRNRIVPNVIMVACVVLFGFLAIREVIDAL